MIKTTILILCLFVSSSFGSLGQVKNVSKGDILEENNQLIYQLDAKSYFDMQGDLLSKDLTIYSLQKENKLLTNKVKIEKEANIWAFYITLGLGIWGYSTCAPYGIVTGSIFLFNSYNNLKEVSK